MLKCAVLDERGVYLGMQDVDDPSDLTDRHLPQITQCDLPAGLYVWVPDDRVHALTGPAGEVLLDADGQPRTAPANQYGGAFWEIAYLQRIAQIRRQAREVNEKKGRLPPVFRNPKLDYLVGFLEQRGLA